MPEISRWSGNDTTKYSIYENAYDDLIDFAKKFSSLYLFGDGKIGSAIYQYLVDSDINDIKIITSQDFDRLKSDKIKNEDGVIVGVSDRYLEEIMPRLESLFAKSHIYMPTVELREEIGEIFDKKSYEDKFWINIYVTNKCNLGCKSCSAFAPICKPDFYELDCFKSDLKMIHDKGFKRINCLKFTGAEAVLHPDILAMLMYARELFPKIIMQMYTNGLFIKNCSLQMLSILEQTGTELIITEYPIDGLDLADSYKKLDQSGIKYSVIYSDEQKYFSKRPLDFNKSTPKHKYISCPRYRMCKSLFMFRGRLYKCIYALSAQYVNEAFGKNLVVKDNDYIEINGSDADDVVKFALHRIPFCSYCSPIEEQFPWAMSNKSIDEWT